jgi:N-acetylmuramoyl-L-alanine amidase
VCGEVVNKLRRQGINAHHLNPGPYNIPLAERVKLVNDLTERFRKDGHETVFTEIHANAAGIGWSSANGTIVFHSNHYSSRSVGLANIMKDEFIRVGRPQRRGGIEAKNFTMVYRTKPPAVLVECGFMTNKEEVAFLHSNEGRGVIVHALVNSHMIYDKKF